MGRRIIFESDVARAEAAIRARREPDGRDMGRVEGANGAAPSETVPEKDEYSDRLLKLVPAEVIAVFFAVDAAIQSSNNAVPGLLYWGITLLLAAGAYLYVMRTSSEKDKPPPYLQAGLATLSFVVWVFAIGGPFEYSQFSWYGPAWHGILLPIYTFFVPLLLPR